MCSRVDIAVLELVVVSRGFLYVSRYCSYVL